MQISIKADLKQATRFLAIAKREIPFAAARAITQTVAVARRDLIQQMDTDLDRPTSFTKRGVRFEKATKRTLTGRVFLAPIQDEYLERQIFGGVGKPKGIAWAIPPVKNPKPGLRDAHGNVKRGQRARKLLRKNNHFSAEINGIPGVWKRGRKKGSVELVLAYAQQGRYKPRYRFFEAGQDSIRRNLPRLMRESLLKAIRESTR
jgi:hypothetical protein